jgi:hypothetical protein
VGYKMMFAAAADDDERRDKINKIVDIRLTISLPHYPANARLNNVLNIAKLSEFERYSFLKIKFDIRD